MFTRSLTEEHLSCFQVLTITNKTAINIPVKIVTLNTCYGGREAKNQGSDLGFEGGAVSTSRRSWRDILGRQNKESN